MVKFTKEVRDGKLVMVVSTYVDSKLASKEIRQFKGANHGQPECATLASGAAKGIALSSTSSAR